jgi:AbrB family looped-hinge helix DNA binding protein
MIESTITEKGQTTVPKEVRDALGLKPRQRLRIWPKRDGCSPEPSALALFGSLKTNRSVGIREEKAAMRKYVASRGNKN